MPMEMAVSATKVLTSPRIVRVLSSHSLHRLTRRLRYVVDRVGRDVLVEVIAFAPLRVGVDDPEPGVFAAIEDTATDRVQAPRVRRRADPLDAELLRGPG